MKRKPRAKDETIFARGLGRQVIALAVVLAILTLIGFYYGHVTHGLDAFSPTLGAEDKTYAELVTMVGPEEVPAEWDSLTTEQRISALEGGSSDSSGGHSDAQGLLGALESLPRTIAFTVLALGQMFHVAGIHAGDSVSFFRVGFKSNRILMWAVLSTFVLQLLVLYVPFMNRILDTYPMGLKDLLVSLVLAFFVLLATEADRILFGKKASA